MSPPRPFKLYHNQANQTCWIVPLYGEFFLYRNHVAGWVITCLGINYFLSLFGLRLRVLGQVASRISHLLVLYLEIVSSGKSTMQQWQFQFKYFKIGNTEEDALTKARPGYIHVCMGFKRFERRIQYFLATALERRQDPLANCRRMLAFTTYRTCQKNNSRQGTVCHWQRVANTSTGISNKVTRKLKSIYSILQLLPEGIG